MGLPADPKMLVAALPDEPRWIETRALLFGDCIVRSSTDGRGALVLDRDLTTGSLVGSADVALLRDSLVDVGPGFELLVQVDALERARQALPGWRAAPVVVHRLPGVYVRNSQGRGFGSLPRPRRAGSRDCPRTFSTRHPRMLWRCNSSPALSSRRARRVT